MLVRSVIYGWGFDFMRPFQKQRDQTERFGSFFLDKSDTS